MATFTGEVAPFDITAIALNGWTFSVLDFGITSQSTSSPTVGQIWPRGNW